MINCMFTLMNDSIITWMFFRSFARFYCFTARGTADTSWDMEQSQDQSCAPNAVPWCWPLRSSPQSGPGLRAVNHLTVAELTVLKAQKVLYIYIVGRKGKAIVVKLCPQSQNRWVFLQKQAGELTCWRYTLNSRIQSQQKGGENISSDLFIYLD